MPTYTVSLGLKKMNFFIENSISSKQHEEVSGTGLENVRRRLHLLYPNSHQLAIENDGTKFSVNLQLSIA